MADDTVRDTGAIIRLPEGTTHVRFDEVNGLIASALHPQEDALDDNVIEQQWAIDQARLRRAGRKRQLGRPIPITDRELAVMQLPDELERAVREGRLIVRNPLTHEILPMPGIGALKNALVAVGDLRRFVSDRGIEVVIGKAALAPRVAEAGATAPWKATAQERARAIIAEQRARDFFPPQKAIADQIAREFRAAVPQIVGADGKPLTGETIKRHALRGISSAQDKARSTAEHRGKRGK